MRIAYLGPPGTFSHEALRGAPEAAGAQLVACPTVRDAVLAVPHGLADRALVPMENALEGSVDATLDTLVAAAPELEIVGERVHRVRLCLIGAARVDLDGVPRVRSHPQASAQCAAFLRAELPRAEVLASASTVEAVRIVVEEDRAAAAVAPCAAAERYGAQVLREDIGDDADNVTRFVWLAAGAGARTVRGDGRPFRTSIVFAGAGADAPGWLVRCLSELAFRGVNLTRIESRPLRAGLGSYRFFVDLEGAAGDPDVADALDGLARQVSELRVLGSYPAAGRAAARSG